MSALPRGWKLLSSKYLHKEQWLTVRKDELQLPNGHHLPDYYVLEYADWVNVVAITTEDKLIILRQYRHGIGRTDFEICAGACDKKDKSPLESAKRELLEETGYGGGEWQEWMKLAPNSSTSNNWVHCFLATGVERLGEPQPESSEEISVHLLSVEEVRDLVMTGRIIQATQLPPLWKYLYMCEVK